MPLLILALLLVPSLGHADNLPAQNAAVVIELAIDVWSRPLAPGEKPSDDLRETQLLINEKVLIHESSGPWVRIEAVEQPTFRQHNHWEGYPGWVWKDALGPPELSRKPLPEHLEDPLTFATTAIGVRYLWGGLTYKGFDCSGLVHLAYRKHGMVIPRDSHEQWMKAKHIYRADLKPADLIFSAKADTPQKVTHVALYAGNGRIIEAPQTGMVVRNISFKEKHGKDLSQVESGDTVGERVIYFGSYLH
jgi:hypothetical protein